jgi:hypothetical protein
MEINIQNLAGGAVAERIEHELKRIFENIKDPNTDAKKVRKLALNLTFQADEKRDLANLSFQAKPTLAPAKSIETKIIMDYDNNGRVTGAELKSGMKGQTYIDEEGDVADDKGNKVVNIRK